MTENEPQTALTAAVSDQMPQIELVQLAREIALDIKELPEILRSFQVTEAQFEEIKKNEWFQKVLEAQVLEWQGAIRTPDRIRIEAAAILEDGLVSLGAAIVNESETLSARVSAADLLAKISGLHKPELQQTSQGEKFTININLGADQKVVYDVTPTATIEESSGPIQAFPEGGGDRVPVPALPSGA